MRKLIAAMKVSADQKVVGPNGYADWVDAWSEDYGLMPQVDACLLGAGMYPGYEGKYWSQIQQAPDQPLSMTGKLPTAGEVKWARFAAETPHYVLSSTLTKAAWPKTKFLRSLEEVTALKQQPGKDIYLMGGARTTASLIDAGLVDEIRLIVYPVIAGGGKPLLVEDGHRHVLELRKVQPLDDGRLSLVYGMDHPQRL